MFTTEERVCPICSGLAIEDRRRAAADERAASSQSERPEAPQPGDGRRIFLREWTPDEYAKAAAMKRSKEVAGGNS